MARRKLVLPGRLWVTANQAAVARRQVAAGQQFRTHLETDWAACEAWADAQLDAPAGSPVVRVSRCA